MVRIVTLLFLAVCANAFAQSGGAVPYFPMSVTARDGKSLAVDVYATDTVVAKPVILIQTPYNKNFYRLSVNIPEVAGGAPFPYDSANYNYVVADWRGFYGSKDASVNGYDRGLDGYDIVEWIARQRWCNGKVGTWGPSALGAIQFMTARHRPPHLVCAVPLVKDFKTKYTDSYYGGVFRKEHVESLEALGLSQTQLVLSHPTNDLTWQVVERNSDYPDSFNVPMLFIGGWFDHYPDDILRAFDDVQRRSAPEVRGRHKLVIGPWMHGGVGKSEQGVLTFAGVEGYSDSIALRFFDHYLRSQANGYPSDAAVRYYQMGNNEWRTASSWYDVARAGDTMSLFLRPGRELGTIPTASVDSFMFDPRNPSPTYGGSRLAPFNASAVDGPQDIRDSVESRADALVYSTPPLERDLVVAGGIHVELQVESNRADTDFGVRLCDVYPDGRSVLLTQGIRRARFRNGLRPQDTAPMTPGSVQRVTVELQNIAMTFKAGHRLRIVITGSNYPVYDLNPNTGGPLYKAGDTLVATNVIHQGGARASRVIMPVVGSIGAVGSEERAMGCAIVNVAPMPASGPAAISYRLQVAGHVTLSLYDLAGNEVARPVDGFRESGTHVATWEPAQALASGVYIWRLVAGGSVAGGSAAGGSVVERSVVERRMILSR